MKLLFAFFGSPSPRKYLFQICNLSRRIYLKQFKHALERPEKYPDIITLSRDLSLIPVQLPTDAGSAI
jgi:hypothetical protein